VVALALTSPMPWALGRVEVSFAPTMVFVIVLAVAAMPMGRWAAGSWTTAALIGAVVNVFWSYSLFVDPAAGPWLGLFLLVPYLAFTVAGCIGFFRESRPRRWIGVVVPPVLYVLPFFVADVVIRMRFPR
jgi:hypothetical protein